MRAIISEGSTSVLIPAVLTGRVSGAIIHLPVDDPELVIEPLFAEDLVVVAHAEHPLAGEGEMRLAEVATHRLLLPPAGAALRRVLDRAAGTVGVQLRAQAEIDGVRLLASLAADGHGAAIVPATAVPQLGDRTLRRRARAGAPAAGRRPRPPAPSARRARRPAPCSRSCASVVARPRPPAARRARRHRPRSRSAGRSDRLATSCERARVARASDRRGSA